MNDFFGYLMALGILALPVALIFPRGFRGRLHALRVAIGMVAFGALGFALTQ